MAGSAARLPYVVATAHSPAPVGATPVSPMHGRGGSSAIRAISPLHHVIPMVPGQQLSAQLMRPVSHQQLSAKPPEGNPFGQPAFMTPRMASRPRSPDPKVQQASVSAASPEAGSGSVPGGDVRQPAWAFRAERSTSDDGSPTIDLQSRTIRTSSPMAATGRAVSPQIMQGGRSAQGGISFQGRFVQSPARGQGQVFHMPTRSLSPIQAQQVVGPRTQVIRTASPGAPAVRGAGFSWTQVQASFSPREGSPIGATRAASPVNAMAQPIGFSFKPDPPSPRLLSRNISPMQTPSALTFPKPGVVVTTGSSNRVQARR